MKNTWSVIGYISGFLMFICVIYWFFRWWGLGGAIAGVMFFPLAVLFPFIYLFIEGFSLFYFGLWAVSLIGMYLGQKDEEENEKKSAIQE